MISCKNWWQEIELEKLKKLEIRKKQKHVVDNIQDRQYICV